ncbi:hypothetical protein [Vibrio vulnificus YJ016]|uniref:Uncharacterized protein n=1 Tax=Vibrio vulnificus (strain YJ016) TaxID=196600 RepID=Q7MKE3_VIBVY|nr:hypothetical protein [Vibrio vulnificus]BAC94622.1 hypothetical protein [Vibrio vulnificus YJ016]
MRNTTGLTDRQIEQIVAMWEFITQADDNQETYFDGSIIQGLDIKLDISKAHGTIRLQHLLNRPIQCV